MLAVRCAAFDFSFCPFVLSTLPSGGAGGISGAGGVTEALDSQSDSSLFFINSSCSLGTLCFPAPELIRQTSSSSCSSIDLCLFLRWKMLSSNVILPNVTA